ncbi:hypothetical protein BT69DRAFT_1263575 [Atractiella rhizophila]|nr:hypothetical protein BT69DRAFT_1263575 [Atractiella rhizophila]
MLPFLLIVQLLAVTDAQTCQTTLTPVHEISTAPEVSLSIAANGLTTPRGIVLDHFNSDFSNTVLLVVESGVGISLLRENTATCPGGWERTLLVDQPDLNHGIELTGFSTLDKSNVKLYASSVESAYRWSYDPSTFTVGEAEKLINGMTNDDHSTRTLLLDDNEEYLYISRGSWANVDPQALDPNTGSSQIRRVLVSELGGGVVKAFTDLELVSWGNRNGVGISFDDAGQLWEVENSADNVATDAYGDIHFDNPAEELNLIALPPFEGAVPNHGYPWCLTVWNVTSSTTRPVPSPPAIGSVFSINTTAVSDEECQDTSKYVPPRLSMQAHSAPLDIKFLGRQRLAGQRDLTCNSPGLSCLWRDDAFVSFHGSWNRQPPTGYKVIRISWGEREPEAAPDAGNGYNDVIWAPNTSVCPSKCARPVGLVFDKRGRLFVTSDATGEVIELNGVAATRKRGIPSMYYRGK